MSRKTQTLLHRARLLIVAPLNLCLVNHSLFKQTQKDFQSSRERMANPLNQDTWTFCVLSGMFSGSWCALESTLQKRSEPSGKGPVLLCLDIK
jgi:hypothetical protein